jgi:hypothetical protein
MKRRLFTFLIICAFAASALATWRPKDNASIDALITAGYPGLTSQRVREIGQTVENCPPANWDDCYNLLQGSTVAAERNFAATLFDPGSAPSATPIPAGSGIVGSVTADSITTLRALPTPAGGASSVQLNGYYSAGDGGGGSFYFSPTSVANDNSGTVIAPTVGSGRWLRVITGPTLLPQWFGAKADGATDDRNAIKGAGDALTSGGTVSFPAGTFIIANQASAISLNHMFLTYQGAGPGATILKRATFTGSMFFSSTSTAVHTIVFRDLTIDGGAQSLTSNTSTIGIGPNVWRVSFKNVVFRNIPKSSLVIDGTHDLDFEDCVFEDPGTCKSTAVQMQNGVRNVNFTRCKFRYLFQGIIQKDAKLYDTVKVTDCSFEGDARYQVASYSNSGGTVSYSATVLTDTAATFDLNANRDATVVGLTGQFIRVMNTRMTGSGGTVTYVNNKLTDTGANFSTVQEGDIVRAGTAFGIVRTVISSTELAMKDGWLNDSDRYYAAAPAAGTAYTVYDPVYGQETAFTGTTITVNRWFDSTGATRSTPASGTPYEVSWTLPNYQGVLAGTGSRNWIVKGCDFSGGSSDQLAFNGGTQHEVSGNYIHDGRDVGITIQCDHSVFSDNIVDRQGAQGIGFDLSASYNLVSKNTCTRTPIVSNSTTFGGDIQLGRGASNNIIDGNFCDGMGMPNARAGIGLYSSGAPNIDGNIIINTTSRGHSGGSEISIVGATVTNTLLNNPAIPPASISDTGTGTYFTGQLRGAGSPEGVVKAPIGTTYLRIDGGAGTTQYVKESGTSNTGWVAK